LLMAFGKILAFCNRREFLDIRLPPPTASRSNGLETVGAATAILVIAIGAAPMNRLLVPRRSWLQVRRVYRFAEEVRGRDRLSRLLLRAQPGELLEVRSWRPTRR